MTCDTDYSGFKEFIRSASESQQSEDGSHHWVAHVGGRVLLIVHSSVMNNAEKSGCKTRRSRSTVSRHFQLWQ